MTFKLYYLIDQDGDINGDKTLQGSYSDLSSAQAQAASDSMDHYSVEQTVDNVVYSIVYIC
jgi:hypothetical protein